MRSVAIKKSISVIAAGALAFSMLPTLLDGSRAEAKSFENENSPAVLQSSPNTTMSAAKIIPLNGNASAAYDENDLDGWWRADYWFKFQTSNRNSVYEIKASALDSGVATRYIVDSNGTYPLDQLGFQIGGGSPIKTSYLKLRGASDKKAWMYVYIRCLKGNCKYGDRFTVSVKERPVLKKATSLKASKRAKSFISMKWAKQANATKYQIKYKAKGGSWKTKTSTTNSIKLTKLKKGTAYQVKVRAYCKSGYDHNADKASNYGAWSAIKTIKTK